MRALFRGAPVGDATATASLARRLVALGMAHPIPPPWPGRPALAVVIPVKDDDAGVGRTLDALSGAPCRPAGPTGPEVVVVDDASSDRPGLLRAVAGRATVIHRDASGGPGAARTTGLAATSAPLVAFVDAGVEASVAALDHLARHLADPVVAAAAARVVSTPGPGRLSRYERSHSPLDLGPLAGAVRPGSPVPYVPTACLVVRAASVAAVGGFDPSLRYGEDVDLVWRLVEAGCDVRYDPTVVVRHPPRPTLRAWLRQRVAYGGSAGPLAGRHGSMVSPSRCSAWSAAVWALFVSGHPVAALALAGWTARALRPKLDAVPDAAVEAVRLTATGHWWAGRNLSHQLVRSWWPVTAVAAVARPGGRRLVVFGVAASAAGHWHPDRGHRLETVALGLLDDLAYGTGVWWGLRTRASAAALLPELVAWPAARDEPAGEVTAR